MITYLQHTDYCDKMKTILQYINLKSNNVNSFIHTDYSDNTVNEEEVEVNNGDNNVANIA